MEGDATPRNEREALALCIAGMVAEAHARGRREMMEAFLDCAQYDAKMEGPTFKGWDRSALDRLRREAEATIHGRSRSTNDA